MKILMLGWELPPHNSGGLGVACYYLSKALADHGLDIDFVLPYKAKHESSSFMKVSAATNVSIENKSTIFQAYDGFCEQCTTYEECTHSEKDIYTLQKHYTKYVLDKITRDVPDVIHAHDWLTFGAGVAAKQKTGIPLIAHVHATEFDRAGSLHSGGNPIIHDIEYNGLLMADRIIAVSQATKQLIVRRYGIPAQKIEVIHNSIDTDSVDMQVVQDTSYQYVQALKREGYCVVSTIGRLTVQKGLSYFMDAAGRASTVYDKFVFLIAGDGEQKNELIRLSADYGIADKVLFTGFVRGDAWREIYQLSDIFVMSSVSEPFGLTALEAAAFDTAVVLTNQSGVGEVLQNVMRYDYWDSQRLADEMVNIASSNALRHELGSNLQDEFYRFTWLDVAKRMMGVYEDHAKELVNA